MTGEEKQAIKDLIVSARAHIVEMDKLMKGPASYERGMKIANSVTKLQRQIEETEHLVKEKFSGD